MRRSRRLPLILAVVLIVGAASVASWWVWDRREVGDPAPPAPSLATAEIVRQDMSTSVSMSGRLGHGTAVPVKGGRPGIVTWLPSPGATIKRGQTIYRVDDEQVPIFYGNTPLFRTLDKPGTVGRDVRVVADNLEALGYTVGRRYGPGERVPQTTPVTLVRKGEDVLTPSLAQAIKRWRDDIGLPTSSALGIGDVAVLRGPVRVESTTAQVGDSAEMPLLTVTATTKVVTVDMEPTAAAGMRKGVAVEVRLPDDRTLPAKVSGVATAVTDDPNGPSKLTVTLALATPAAVAKLDAAPVEVTFPGETRNDVLVAPVGALVALAEGGYAVQLAGGGLVTVETGLFAGGLVELRGEGVTEGTRVVTTS
jgi:hypothetical protein